MDFKVRGLEFKSRRVQNNKKLGGGARSRDKVRGSIGLGLWIGLGIVIGLGLGVSVLLFLRNTPPLPPQKKKWKSHLVRRKLTS